MGLNQRSLAVIASAFAGLALAAGSAAAATCRHPAGVLCRRCRPSGHDEKPPPALYQGHCDDRPRRHIGRRHLPTGVAGDGVCGSDIAQNV